MNWRDPSGNSLLHLSAWRGDLRMCRAVLEAGVKARKLAAMQNEEGATPMAMAIIAGQVRCGRIAAVISVVVVLLLLLLLVLLLLLLLLF